MAARKHIRRILECCTRQVVPGVKEGFKEGACFDLSVPWSLFYRPLLLPTFDALLQRHVGVGGTAGLDANSPRAIRRPRPFELWDPESASNHEPACCKPIHSLSHSPDHFDSCTRPFQSYPIIYPLAWLPQGCVFKHALSRSDTRPFPQPLCHWESRRLRRKAYIMKPPESFI